MAIPITQHAAYAPWNAVCTAVGDYVVAFNKGDASGYAGRVSIFHTPSKSATAWQLVAPTTMTGWNTQNAITVGDRAWCAFTSTTTAPTPTILVSVEPITKTVVYYNMGNLQGVPSLCAVGDVIHVLSSGASSTAIPRFDVSAGSIAAPLAWTSGDRRCNVTPLYVGGKIAYSGIAAGNNNRVLLDPTTGNVTATAVATAVSGTQGAIISGVAYWRATTSTGLVLVTCDGTNWGTHPVAMAPGASLEAVGTKLYSMVTGPVRVWCHDVATGVTETAEVSPTRTAANDAAVSNGQIWFPCRD